MNPIVALDYATKHRTVANQIIRDCDDFELIELALELTRLFSYAAHKLRTEYGWLATFLAIQEIANATNEQWTVRHAAEVILNDSMMSDPALYEFGSDAMQKRWHVITVTADVADVIEAIPALWFRMLPELDTPMLEAFAEELWEAM